MANTNTPTNGILHWGNRLGAIRSDCDAMLTVPVTLNGPITPTAMDGLRSALVARSTPTHLFTLDELTEEMQNGVVGATHTAWVHGIRL